MKALVYHGPGQKSWDEVPAPTITTSHLYGPSRVITIDLDEKRIAEAAEFGATDGVVASDPEWKSKVLAMTDGLGVDVAIEAVGVPATWQMCVGIVRPAGTVADMGVHGESVELALQDLWISNIDIAVGLVNANTVGTPVTIVASRQLDPDPFISHRFALDEIMDAYDVFGNAAETKALKVVLTA